MTMEALKGWIWRLMHFSCLWWHISCGFRVNVGVLLPKIFAVTWELRQIPPKPEAHSYTSADIFIINLISPDCGSAELI